MSPTRRAWQRPQLRTDEEFHQHRAVSWLELFFDLVFVVVIARLADHLGTHVDGAGLAGFSVQFVAVFWVWNAYTYYAERFESDGLENRLFTFLALLPAAGLAVYGGQGLPGGYVGFTLAYLLARAVNIASWLWAGVNVPVFRPIAARFATGYLVTVALILASLAGSDPIRVVLFGVAVLVEIVTPYFTVAQQSVLPRLSTSKFPERFGLFTIIVLGQSVAGVIAGLSRLADRGVLDAQGVVLGVLGLAIGFALWWIYFDFVARRPPRPVFLAALLWVYLHLITMTAITLIGVGVSVSIDQAAVGGLSDPSRYLLVGGVVLALVGVGALQLTLDRAPDEPTHARFSPALKVSVALVLGVLGVLNLGWSALALLLTVLAGLAVPITYGAYVWFTQELDGVAAPALIAADREGSAPTPQPAAGGDRWPEDPAH